MSNYLKKENVFFERNESGEVVPIETTLETLDDKPIVRLTPLTKGELTEISKRAENIDEDTDLDIDIIVKHCHEPNITEEDRESLKKAGRIKYTNAIATAIISLSTDVPQEQIIEQGKEQAMNKKVEGFTKQ